MRSIVTATTPVTTTLAMRRVDASTASWLDRFAPQAGEHAEGDGCTYFQGNRGRGEAAGFGLHSP
jgi:hypothetical protein